MDGHLRGQESVAMGQGKGPMNAGGKFQGKFLGRLGAPI